MRPCLISNWLRSKDMILPLITTRLKQNFKGWSDNAFTLNFCRTFSRAEGQAFQIVKEIDDLNEIWDRLQQAFGNVTTMLSLKIKTLDKNEPLSKIRSEEKLVMSLTKLKNCMVELSSLAKKHSIQTELYHTSNLSKIFQLVGKQRQRKVIKNVRNTFTGSVDNEQLWQNTVTLLDDEIQDVESMVLFNPIHIGGGG